jgi:hypothetical protein
MPRAKKQGGKRQGTPGQGYANRTDLMQNYDMQAASPAAGPPMAAPGTPPMTPDDLPSLSSPTAAPDEPITAGLPIGAGEGPAQFDLAADVASLQRFLPLIEPVLNAPDTPQSVKMLYRYIRSGG